MYGLDRSGRRPELWVQPRGDEQLRYFGERFGRETMFEDCFLVKEYREREQFTAAGLSVTPLRLPHYGLETYGFRVSNGNRTVAYSGDSAPSERLAELARDVDLFVCEATLERGELDGEPRGHLSAEEASAAFAASGARRLLITHRPSELPLDGLELAHDGLELDV
jgi:ribonuclease BN (tRNA processing enzyme)